MGDDKVVVMIRRLLWVAVVGFVAVVVGCGGDGSDDASTAPPGSTEAPAALVVGCPPDADPDRLGPADGLRPTPESYRWASTAFDPDGHRLVMLTQDGGELWSYDVCTNTWAEGRAPDGGIAAPLFCATELVHVVDPDRLLALESTDGSDAVRIRAYDPEDGTWSDEAEVSISVAGESGGCLQAIHDPVSGRVLVRAPWTSQMWAYDLGTGAWSEIDQGNGPPASAPDARDQLLAHDASVHRLVLYVPHPGGDSAARAETWEYDLRSSRWEEQDAATPDLSFGWAANGDELLYDPVDEVSVLHTYGTVAVYDASEHRWTVLDHEASPPRTDFATGFDPVNGRVVVAGGLMSRDDVVAFDVATGGWITLLELSGSGSGS